MITRFCICLICIRTPKSSKKASLKEESTQRCFPLPAGLPLKAGRKFTITEEYFSLTALLGNVFTLLHKRGGQSANSVAFLIPQNEGAETDGQYSRLLRTKLDEEGFEGIDIVSPFWEGRALHG